MNSRVLHAGVMAPFPVVHHGHVLTRFQRITMLLGLFCFLGGVLTGVWKIALTRGFLLPGIPDFWPQHGHWMLTGFLTTIIMLERLVAMGSTFFLWIPFAYAGGALTLQTGFIGSRILVLLAFAGWVLHRIRAVRHFQSLEKPSTEIGAFAVLTLILLQKRGFAQRPDFALAGFFAIISIIALERLEIFMKLDRRGPKYTWVSLLVLLGYSGYTIFQSEPHIPFYGLLALIVMGLVAYHDASVRTALQSLKNRQMLRAFPPLYRSVTQALYVAYFWLFTGILFMLMWSKLPGATAKDMLFHSFGLGFIMSMILAHLPIMMPVFLGGKPVQRVPMALFWTFQVATFFRIGADLFVAQQMILWKWSGWITGLVHLIVFFAYAFRIMYQSKMHQRK